MGAFLYQECVRLGHGSNVDVGVLHLAPTHDEHDEGNDGEDGADDVDEGDDAQNGSDELQDGGGVEGLHTVAAREVGVVAQAAVGHQAHDEGNEVDNAGNDATGNGNHRAQGSHDVEDGGGANLFDVVAGVAVKLFVEVAQTEEIVHVSQYRQDGHHIDIPARTTRQG